MYIKHNKNKIKNTESIVKYWIGLMEERILEMYIDLYTVLHINMFLILLCC